MSDKDLLGQGIVIGLMNVEQGVNAAEERIDSLTAMLQDFPGPMNPINSTPYIIWERRVMMKVGGVEGFVSGLVAGNTIPFEIGERLKHRAIGIMNRAVAKVQMGSRS